VTFLALFLVLAAARGLELAGALREDFFAVLEADFPAFRAGFTDFLEALAALPADLEAFLATGLGALLTLPAARFVAAFLAASLDFLASTAPIAARMRLISRVTCSMVIMPSTVSSLRRSE
jgi:hypothetical protein